MALTSEDYKLISKNQLTINLKLIVILGEQQHSKLPVNVGKLIPSCTLSTDMLALLNDKSSADIIFKIGDKEFHAHKLILGARCDVFKAMFSSTFKESAGVVEITDVNSEIFQDLLTYLYTGKMPNILEYPDELFVAADKYCLLRLRICCENIMIINMQEHVVLAYYVLAHFHNAPELKQACQNFINIHAPQLTQTEEFEVFATQHPELMHELYASFIDFIHNPTSKDVNSEVVTNSQSDEDID